MVEFTVTILGSGSAVPMYGRHPSAQVIQYGDSFFLIDCGEGTQLLFREAGIKPFKIQVILISHLHGDHVFGLPGLLSTFNHLGRTDPLVIYGPKGIQDFLHAIIQYSELKIRYPLEIVELETTEVHKIYETADLEVSTFPLRHRIKCQGYLFREKKASVHFNKQTLTKFHLSPDQIKSAIQGEDVFAGGELIPRDDIFLPAIDPVSYAYCSDTAFSHSLSAWLKSVSVLYHEATFLNELEELARETGHSTAREAAQIALDADVGCLMLGHYSSRYKNLDELLAEAKTTFPNTILSVEGRLYKLRDLREAQAQ